VVAAAVLHATGGGLRLPSALAADSPGHSGAAARQAIRYARAQLGKPYQWGATGPGAFDCSGLVERAYAAAGVSIPRTSEQQWADLPHVPARRVKPGDLVFAPGSDGSWSSPGHVALVIGGARVIQAYGSGTPIEVSSLSRFAAGSGGIVGYARPQ
jgi:cell wall-associated NlpC family hydrolase